MNNLTTIQKIIFYGLIVIIVGVVVACIYFWFQKNSLEAELSKVTDSLFVNKQNALAYKDSLKLIKGKNDTLWHKYATVESEKIYLNDLLEERDERIISLNKIILNFNKQISKGEQNFIIVDGDTIFRKGYIKDIIVPFNGENEFTFYNGHTGTKPPRHQIGMNHKPIDLITYLTRNNKGEWSGYAETNTPGLHFSKFEPIVIDDFFLAVEKIPVIKKWSVDVAALYNWKKDFVMISSGLYYRSVGIRGALLQGDWYAGASYRYNF